MTAKHIGIVACSVEGAALCYRTVAAESEALLGEHQHPEMSVHTHQLADYMKAIRSGDWDAVAALMLDSARKLASIGAEFIVCPDNTIHQALPLLAVGSKQSAGADNDRLLPTAHRLPPTLVHPGRSPVPWLHIARVVAGEATRRGYRQLGVLGTKYTCDGPVYRKALAEAGLGHAVPEKAEREKIDEIIFRELVKGKFLQASRGYVIHVVHKLRELGCDAVVLGCTEIPLLVEPKDSPLPVLDSTRLLARAALLHSVGKDEAKSAAKKTGPKSRRKA
ncbi:MAG TPA: amino acid racemase [Planctomycetota bacterium]|nr:amino acid racemase [Planctomycetota bacterium]